jgi:anionic cell wall polymer biosynthesis LytR-Cps2A-Psr (LCP) family protein
MPQIIQELRQALITNFSNEELINLGLWFKDLNERVMITDMMPGEAAYIEGVSYWEPDLDTSKKLVTEFFLKEKRVEEQPNES